jgi:hypothetical protein
MTPLNQANTSKTVQEMMLQSPNRTITIDKAKNGWTAQFWEANVKMVFEATSGTDLILHICRYLDIVDLDWDKDDWDTASLSLGFKRSESREPDKGGEKATVDASDV